MITNYNRGASLLIGKIFSIIKIILLTLVLGKPQNPWTLMSKTAFNKNIYEFFRGLLCGKSAQCFASITFFNPQNKHTKVYFIPILQVGDYNLQCCGGNACQSQGLNLSLQGSNVWPLSNMLPPFLQ